jgi:hypothetical protein
MTNQFLETNEKPSSHTAERFESRWGGNERKENVEIKKNFTQNVLICMQLLHPSAIRHSILPRLWPYFVHVNESVREKERWENSVVWSGL